MRKIFNSILSGIAKNELLWKVSKPFVAIGLTLEKIRTTYLNEEDKKHKKSLSENSRRVCESLESSLVVLNGPFKGLKYSSDNSFGSAFYPKLLGVYEKELHVVFNQIQNNNYSEIIDVGCAEGYYA
ncbi:MAG: hypothetical protein KJO64_06945, partial [Bacteroidia bacterium]|nr:hypothetical protein [Bacteroidia bacterium]